MLLMSDHADTHMLFNFSFFKLNISDMQETLVLYPHPIQKQIEKGYSTGSGHESKET